MVTVRSIALIFVGLKSRIRMSTLIERELRQVSFVVFDVVVSHQ
jgi:hypothetical protein